MPRKKALAGSISGINNYFICHWCNKKFIKRRCITDHLRKCSKHDKSTTRRIEIWRQRLTCVYCKVLYPNRTLLVRHIDKVHPEQSDPKTNAENDKTIKGSSMQDELANDQNVTLEKGDSISEGGTQKVQSNSPLKKCEVCTETCPSMTKLWLHIRKEHFNLQAKLPYCDQKKVNQVWFEKVLNCNNIMEIRKTGPNTLVMRKLDEKTSIKVFENNTKIIDLSDLYPTKL